MNAFDRLLQQIGAFWRSMNGAQRVALLSVVLITLGALGLIVSFAGQTEFGTLYTELDPKDAASITEQLSAQGVPYELTQGGRTVRVPANRIYDVRLDLATQGLPAAGPIGFEVFDEAGLGMTPFQQRVHFRRALEGELGRTISRLRNVDWVRVHINLPDRTVFRRDTKSASAAVVMGLAAGRVLRPSETMGIAHLVSGAVEGLESGQVTILDERGGILAKPGSEDDDALATEAFGLQAAIEKGLAKRAQSLLDAALGSGKSVVTVAATINRKRFEERKESVNPDQSAVLSEQRTEESRSTPNDSFGGVPGTASNLPGGAAAEGASATSTETITRETINFDVSRSTSQTFVPVGEVQRLSIAVIIDGSYAPAPAAEPTGEDAAEEETTEATELVYSPRGEEELQQLREIVMRATGFDAERGDEIVVQNLQFRPDAEAFGLEPPGFLDRPEVWMMLPGLVKSIALLGGLGLLVLFVLRPALQQLASVPLERAPAGEDAATPGLPEGAAELAIPVSRDQAAQVAEAMRQWLRE